MASSTAISMFRITLMLTAILLFFLLPKLGRSTQAEFDWATENPDQISFEYKMGSVKLDPLTLTASDLRILLDNGTVSTVDLVELYLSQIAKHNHQGAKLNAIITIAPQDLTLHLARQLDSERSRGQLRSPMHGIPIVLKDTFLTPSLGMETTCGSLALKGQQASKDAVTVELLIKAGMIIIGKTNLSEWCSYKSYNLTCGWSPVGGQTQSPYVKGGVTYPTPFLGHTTPAGSSSGSAVSVAAGFSPVSLGTETDGSVVQPATRAALYGLKATHGSTNLDGVQPGAHSFDCLGAFAKTPADLALILNIIMERQDLGSSLDRSWGGVRVGFVDATLWEFPEGVCEYNPEFRKQMVFEIATAISQISADGAHVVNPVELTQFFDLFKDPAGVKSMQQLISYEFKNDIGGFLSLFPDSPVKTLEDIIKFNEAHAKEELPPHQSKQDTFYDMLKDDLSPTKFSSSLTILRKAASSAIQKTLSENSIDVIIGPSDGMFASMASAAGFPVASMPLGFATFNGRAFGVQVLAKAGDEEIILRVMSAWEASFPHSRAPPLSLLS